jgi:hypothetical protein
MLQRNTRLRPCASQALALLLLVALACTAWHASPAASFAPFAETGALPQPLQDGPADDTVDDNDAEPGLLLLAVLALLHPLLMALRRGALFRRPGTLPGLLHPPQLQLAP